MKNGWTIDNIDFQKDKVKRKSLCPQWMCCPECGKSARRKKIETVIIRDIAYQQVAWIIADVGVYRASCTCSKYFRASVPNVPKSGEYSWGVRIAVINAILRDRLPTDLVKQRLKEDFLLDVSTGFIYDCFHRAASMVDRESYWSWVKDNFSGVLCIDELHDGKNKIFFATDPLNDFTVAFKVVSSLSQEEMDKFLDELKERGITPHVVVTDGSPLYKESLTARWKDVEHQLCIFHVLSDINECILVAVSAIRNTIKRQGNKGRKRRRGRPRGRKRPRRQNKKEQASFIRKHQHLIVKKKQDLTEEDRKNLTELFAIASELRTIRRFVCDVYRLFEKGITKQQARNRRTRLMNNPDYQRNPHLVRAMKKLVKPKFEKMIVFLKYDNAERTSNHVERNNRAFRMIQKTRYKRRRKHTIEAALWLELDRRRAKHSLSQSPNANCRAIKLQLSEAA